MTSYSHRIVSTYSVSKSVPVTPASCTSVLALLFCVDLPEALAPGPVCAAPLYSVAFSTSPFASWNSEGCSPIPGPFYNENYRHSVNTVSQKFFGYDLQCYVRFWYSLSPHFIAFNYVISIMSNEMKDNHE